MKIVFLVDQMYLHGGIERVLSIKANYLCELPNYEIHIITTEQKNNSFCYQLSPKIKWKDISINYTRHKSYFNPKNLKKLPSHILKLKNEFNRIKPDIVVVCSHSTDTYFLPFINKSIPKVKEFHFSKFIETNFRKHKKISFKKIFTIFADYVETKYHTLVVLNSDEQSYYKSDNTVIIPNPLTFYPKEKALLKNKIAIAAGRIAGVKQFDHLIDCWSIVIKKHKDWRLEIFGEGDENLMKELLQQIKSLNLQNHVFLMGGSSQIKSKMLNSSMLLMSSANECFPLVLLEAQACGLPTVSYNSPHGPKNIITEKTGYIVEKNNKQALAKKISILISNDKLRNEKGKNAKQNAQKYLLETVMNKWILLFKNLTKET